MDSAAAKKNPAASSGTRKESNPASPAGRDIVVVGASAGGLEALRRLVAALPDDYAGTVLVVLHFRPDTRSELPNLLSAAGPLPAVAAADGMSITPGRIIVAPPDRHLLVERDFVRVVRGPVENRHRPAIDPLFRSAAWAHGPRVVGVVLSGTLDDGTAGLWAIRQCGGVTVVQLPSDAAFPEMPRNALRHNDVDHELPVDEIASLLVRLAHEPVDGTRRPAPPTRIGEEVALARLERRGIDYMDSLGDLTAFTCPTCRGALWELDAGGHLHYRCHTGHSFSQASLLIEQGTAIEESVYMALRAVEEKATALRRLAERWDDRYPMLRDDYRKRAADLDQVASVLRELLAGAAPSENMAPP